jgi:hypothetical protein
MSAAPSGRAAVGRGTVQLDLMPSSSPTAAQLIEALHTALYGALKLRADGSRHHLNCINRHVNAIPRPCSPACEYATGALLLAEDFEAAHAPARRPAAGRTAG